MGGTDADEREAGMDHPPSAAPVQRRHLLDPVPESARTARREVLQALTDAGRDDLADAASLLVSELVTNAIVHARTPIDLVVVAHPEGLRVAVSDQSETLPSPRHYGASATTGRGLALVEHMSDRYGTDAVGGEGKIVWFELGARLDTPPAAGPPARAPGTTRAERAPARLMVHLRGLPLALALAWQQHADTLLREYLLSRWDDEPTTRRAAVAPADDGAAHDAFATVAAALEKLAADGRQAAHVDLVLRLDPDRVGQFAHLNAVLEHTVRQAERGLTLAPPTQPEIREFRRWLVGQVRRQAAGEPPQPWPGISGMLEPLRLPAVEWDTSHVSTAVEAVVAADDLNRIIAASPAALQLLGWDGDLLGRRIVTVIPQRLRETHIAAFTLNLLTGEGRIIGREVTVPALRRDGTEVDIVLLLRREVAGQGRSVYTATMRPA